MSSHKGRLARYRLVGAVKGAHYSEDPRCDKAYRFVSRRGKDGTPPQFHNAERATSKESDGSGGLGRDVEKNESDTKGEMPLDRTVTGTGGP